MRSSRFVRFVGVAAASVALFTGALSIASAQDATAEPTEDAMMSQMMSMKGACPEGAAGMIFDKMSMMMGTEEPGMTSTEEMGMEATEDADMSGMDMSTQEPGMTSTEEMGMEAHCFVAEVKGSNEVPGPGDDDAWGVALISVDAASGTICYDVMVGNLTLPAAANHIHEGAEGVKGGVVVPFPTAPDADGKAWGCTTNADEAKSIVDDPAGYYYNVHTSDFPDGAARGQLTSWDDAVKMMDDMGMDMSGMSTQEPGMDMTPMATEAAGG